MFSYGKNKLFYQKPLLSNFTSPFVFKLPSTASQKKNQHVETLRGLAIILVVFGHMIGYDSTGGMRVSDDSVFRYMYYTLEYIRMPLFTVISGWVYANKPILSTDKSKFVKGKLRRLILPMLAASTLLFLFRMIIPGTNSTPALSDLPRNLILPYDVYWYLFSLFLIFLTITILDNQKFFYSIGGWAVTLICSFVLLYITENFLDPVPNIFSFKGAAYLLPFFLIGIGIFRYRDLLFNANITFLALSVFVAGMIIQQLIWFSELPGQERHSLLGMAIGISGVLLLFKLKLKSSFLIWIGGYAYGIFLFHVFFTGGTRIVLLKSGLENLWVILIAGLVSAIAFSILAETVINRFKVLRFLLLGLRKQEK